MVLCPFLPTWYSEKAITRQAACTTSMVATADRLACQVTAKFDKMAAHAI